MTTQLPPPPLREAKDMPTTWQRWFSSIFGAMPICGTVTITPSATTTTLTIRNATANSIIVMFPATSNARTVDGATIYAVAIEGGFTITHANSATTGRVYNYMVQV